MLADEASLDSDPFADFQAPVPRIDGVVHGLDPAYVTAARLTAMIRAGVLIALTAIAGGVLWAGVGGLEDATKAIVISIVLAANLTVAVLTWVWPALEMKRTSWRVGSEGLEIKRGIVFRHVVSVPASRIQHMDVAQGPIERRFLLGTLVIHTAGTHESEIDLDGISREKALAVRDFLLGESPPHERPADGA